MSKHTPGIWFVTDGGWHVGSDCGTEVCEVFPAGNGNDFPKYGDSVPGPETQANARLIASAPALMLALEAIKWRAHATSYGMGEDVARMAEEAIAKATGEQP